MEQTRTLLWNGPHRQGRDGFLRKSYGMANLELGVPNTPEMIYRIGSITKSFTALAIVQLEAQKKLNVTDPVVKYLPGVPKAWQQITIQQLLTHVSGIPNFTSTAAYVKAEDPLRIDHAVQEMAAQPLDSVPGEKFAYSNSGYNLLGRVIEKISGVTYEHYVTDNIIKPAGLENTAYDHVRPIVKNRASWCEDHVGIGTDGGIGKVELTPEQEKAFKDDVAHRKAAGVSAPEEDRYPYVPDFNGPRKFELIATELQKHDYKSATIEKVLGGNWYRVFGEIWI
jgi:CubicO group peptidase (beta-lactamase class C family)